MEDLWAVDTFLARAMQLMLDADLDNTEFVDLFGVNFVASLNPILKASSSPTASSDSYVELRSNGHDVAVNKSNRKEFVESFLTHALYTSCKSAVDDFIDGLKIMLHTQSLELCTHNEVKHEYHTRFSFFANMCWITGRAYTVWVFLHWRSVSIALPHDVLRRLQRFSPSDSILLGR